MGLKDIILLGIGALVGAGIVWFLTQPKIEEQKRKINLLESRVYEFQTRYESDLNAIREEHNILHKQIQELRASMLAPEMKRKVEELFFALEQAYQTKQTERKLPTYVYF
jgi:predicted RNase H-like nuclease (RuvC/YqgF family)